MKLEGLVQVLLCTSHSTFVRGPVHYSDHIVDGERAHKARLTHC